MNSGCTKCRNQPDPSKVLLSFRRILEVLSLGKIDMLLSPETYRVVLAIGASWVGLFVLTYLVVLGQFLNGIPQSPAVLRALRLVGQLNASVR